MIKLKDVIHYYIGCEVEVDGEERGRLMGANPIPNSVGQVYWDIITEDMKKEDADFCMPYNDDPDMGELRIKPILRRIEDMTEDECDEYNRLNTLMYSIAKGKDQVMQYASATLFAIQQGFDVFGLIDTNQAIAKEVPVG